MIFQTMADPPRFSCGVTGDEVKVSGVISYDECGINTNDMMNLGTGHATVPIDGRKFVLILYGRNDRVNANFVNIIHVVNYHDLHSACCFEIH